MTIVGILCTPVWGVSVEKVAGQPDYEALNAAVNNSEMAVSEEDIITRGRRSCSEHWVELIKWEMM